MTMKIYKYPLYVQEGAEITMPKGAQVLCVQEQNNRPYIWALTDPERPDETRRFSVYGTSWDVTSPPGKYVGTFQLDNGSLVFHVFEN